MNIVGIIGSMRKNGHTNTLVSNIQDEINRIVPTTTSETIYTSDKAIAPCRVVCSDYCTKNPFRCSLADDVAGILERMCAADALIIGAPLYFRGPPAKFQAFTERLISMFYYYESEGDGGRESPLKGKPCGLVGVAEYSNPHQILEYLHDFCTVLKMSPVIIERFPYLGVAWQGKMKEEDVFSSFERSKDLARIIVAEVEKRKKAR